MNKYHKIQSIYKRTDSGRFIFGDYSIPEFDLLKNVKWNFTEKIDGTNIRIHWDGEVVTFAGRTDKAQIPAFLVTRLNEVFLSDETRAKLKEKFNRDDTESVEVCLIGEGYGARIQGGGGNYISDGVDFILFDVRIGGIYLKRENVNEIAEFLGIKSVPTVFTGTLDEGEEFIKKGFTSTFGDFTAEGIVGVPEVELRNRMGLRIVVKIKDKDYRDEKK